jgi:hypothetical protein
MSKRARRWLAERLPESTVYTLVQVRHGETRWQREISRGVWTTRAKFSASRHASQREGAEVGGREIRAQLVTEFDAHRVARDNVLAVSGALESRGVDHVLVPKALTAGRHVAVSAEDAEKALDAVVSMLDTPEWGVAHSVASGPSLHRRQIIPLRASNPRVLAHGGGVEIFRRLVADNGEQVAGPDLGCRLDFWQRVETEGVPRPDGGKFAIGTRLSPDPQATIVGYLSPATWNAAAVSPDHWPREAARRTLFQVREPVDIVYTWVDGSDPTWLSRKAEFDSEGRALGLNVSAIHESRYTSYDELKYSLRSVSMFATWVNKIYIVTDGQVPAWLDATHPKIQMVDHRQIFRDTSVLPVFNSHAIESQLHHIPGLSEQYLYMNDDVFFGRPVEPELFFHGNGVGKFFLSKATLDIDLASADDLPVMSAAKRNRDLIADRFDATVIHKFKHTPHTQLRSVLEQLEREYPKAFAAVARSRFRHPEDLSIPSALHHYYAYGIGRSMPGTIRYAYQDIARADTPRRLSNLLRTRDYDAICLNDHETKPEVMKKQRDILGAFFERYFPVPSPFEIPESCAL